MTVQYAVFIRGTGKNTADATAVIHEEASSAMEAREKVALMLGAGWKTVGALARAGIDVGVQKRDEQSANDA